MSGVRHDANRPDSSHSVQELDSAATTLLASASSTKGHSFDDHRKYADVELERWDASMRKRRESTDSDTEVDDYDDEDGHNEERHLLATETATLNETSHAAETIPDDGEPPPPPSPAHEDGEKKKQVKWRELPKKGQLAILTLARLSEPLTQTSLQSYMFYQLKSFNTVSGEVPSDSTVASQAGVLAAAFTFAQFCTAIMWGRAADWEGLGRKKVILIGLLGTAIGSMGFGFSQSFAQAVFWRCAGGCLNGNVGIMRTMISEIVKEKKFQSRAFLLMPMTFNIGVIIGPLLGGLLADPVGSYPGLFGPGSTFGGKRGVWLFAKFPYALPNMVNATFLFSSALLLVLGLEETLEGAKDKPDYGRRLGKWITRTILRRRQAQQYTAIINNTNEELSDIEATIAKKDRSPKTRQKLPFRRIFTRNVLITLLAHGLLAMHVGTFSNLWFVFLSTPRYDPSSSTSNSEGQYLELPPNYKPHLPFTFTGGLALPPPMIGTALAILGVIGITLQLLVFPRVSFYLGTIKSYRLSMLFFPITYFLVPYLATIPSSTKAPHPAGGVLVWIGITVVLAIQVLARTFALPSTAILVNNCCPHPSVLGSIHGIAQSVSSATRTVGPVIAGYVYGLGLNSGVVGAAWWMMAALSVIGAVAARWVREGDGHEIWLPGEREEEEAVRDLRPK